MKIKIYTRPYIVNESTERLQNDIIYKNVGNYNSITEILTYDEKNKSENRGIVINSGITSISKKQFIELGDKLYIIVGSSVFLVTIPNLELLKTVSPDPSTVFGLYLRKNLIFIHGEQNFSCFDLQLNKKWSFEGRDIFVTTKKSNLISFLPDYIHLEDFSGQKYKLDYDGNLVN